MANAFFGADGFLQSEHFHDASFLMRLSAGWALLSVFVFLSFASAQENFFPQSPKVSFVEAARSVTPVERDYPARLVAAHSVLLQAQVGGYVKARNFKEGAQVEEGSVLYSIDAESYEIAVERTSAQVAAAQATLNFAQTEVERFDALAKENIASKRQLQQLVEQRDGARAQLKRAEAELAATRLDLRRTRITAPITGRVGLAQADVGDLVIANQTPLVSIVQWHPIEAHFNPPARDLSLIENHQSRAPLEVSLFLPDADSDLGVNSHLKGHVFVGKGNLDFIDNQVTKATDSILMRARFSNSEGKLRPGQFVRVRVHITEREDTFLVPRQAVRQRQGEHLLYIVDEADIIEERKVVLGGVFLSQQIILEGVKQGERVIVSDPSQLRAGMTVMPHIASDNQENHSGEPVSRTQP